MKAHLQSAAIFLLLVGGRLLAAEQMDMTSGPAPAAASAPTKPLSRAEELLKRFDKNGDGKLDEDERADAHEEMLLEQAAKGAARDVNREWGTFRAMALELFDRNRDQRLDAEERAAAIAFVQQHAAETIQSVRLKRFDQNADGKLDEAEQRQAQTYLEENRGDFIQEVLLKHFDANQNGLIDAAEKTTIRETFAKTDNVKNAEAVESEKMDSVPARD